MGKLPPLTHIAFASVVLLGLVVHFGFTLLYLMPLNPVKLRIYPVVEAYMHPFFEQNWGLFAPDPINDTRVVLVACRVRAADGTVQTTPWVDITSPYWKRTHEQRFSPAGWVARAHINAVRLAFGQDSLTLRLEEHRTDTPSEYNRLLDAVQVAQQRDRDVGKAVINRVASEHCSRHHGPAQVVEVQARLAVHTFPRFSDRHLPDSHGELSYYDFGWAPFEPVAPLNAGRTS